MENAAILRATIAPPASPSLADRLAFARALIRHGFLSEAIATLDVHVRAGNASGGTFHYLGDALSGMGAFVDALAAYDAALARPQASPPIALQLARARTLRRLGQLPQACAAYAAAIAAREQAGGQVYGEEVYFELARTWAAQGEAAQAGDAFRRWMENAYVADHAGKTAYGWIPKNACTFLKTAMVLNTASAEAFRASRQDAHVFTRQPGSGFLLGDHRHWQDPRYFRFTVLRNPFERLASAFANLFVLPVRLGGVALDGVREATFSVYRRKGLAPDFARSISFEAFIRYLAATGEDADLDYHWRPQHSFFAAGGLGELDFVGRFEALDATLQVLASRRGWRFDSVQSRNATPYAPTGGRRPYHAMLPHALAALPAMPPPEQLFTQELRALAAERFAADFDLYRAQFGIELREPPSGDRSARPVTTRPAAASGAATAVPRFDLVLRAAPEPPQDLPEKLAQAFRAQAEGKSVRVALAPGVYRLSVRCGPAAETGAALVIEAETVGAAVLSGADPLGGWQPEGGLWSAPWPHRWGAAAAPADGGIPYLEAPELMRRREILVANGKLMRQVLDQAELVPGTFRVDEARGKIFLAPPADVAPPTAVIEAAVRSTALHIAGRSNVTVRGLVFRHDGSFHAAPGCAPLQFSDCCDVLVEDCQFVENNNKGLYFGGHRNAGITLRRSQFMRNGCIGLNAAQCEDLLVEQCETSLNNWRGAWAGFYRGWACGFKISRSDRVTVRLHRAVRNMATGGWFDLENRDVRVEDSLFYGNYRGLHLEAGVGPFLVERCQVVANRQEPSVNEFRWAFGSGIVLTHAPDVTLRQNLVSDNDAAQIGVRDDRPKHVVCDKSSGALREWHTERLSLEANTVVGSAFRPVLLHLPDGDFDGGRFWEAFRAEGNVYVGGADFWIGSRRAPAVGAEPPAVLDFQQWRDYSGQDADAAYYAATDAVLGG